MLGTDHLWAALAYVERNPVRAGMVSRAADDRWSSAAAHVSGEDVWGMLDMEWRRRERPANWDQLPAAEAAESTAALRGCTDSGRPFGDENFVSEMEERFGRHWTRGRPRKEPARADVAAKPTDQFPLFETFSAQKK